MLKFLKTGTYTEIMLGLDNILISKYGFTELSSPSLKTLSQKSFFKSADESKYNELEDKDNTIKNKPHGVSSIKSESKERELIQEREWIDLAIKGDMDSFRYLFDRYYLRLKSVAFGILSNEEDAADVCQEAFLKAYKNLSSFKGNSSFYTWMYRIVHNLCIDLSRKSSRKREVTSQDSYVFEQRINDPSGEYFRPSPTSPEYDVYNKEILNGINIAMKDLSPSHRAVIYLREFDGLSYEEISQHVGCSVGTVMSRLHHARKKLCSALEGILGETPSK